MSREKEQGKTVYDLELDTTVASVEEVARRLEEFVSNLRIAEP